MPPALKGLHYVSDQGPGISRQRLKSRGARPAFSYRNAQGRPVKAGSTLDRIRALAIPPAYEEVWICADPLGHIQATGRDARGRKQYRYHPLWRTGKDEIKHARMHDFGLALPKLRRILKRDLGLPGLPRDKVLALVVSLMDLTSVRVGNAEYARNNGSFGLSTLRDQHAHFAGKDTVLLHFPGKSGTIHDVRVQNARLATLVRKCQHLPGQRLFQYRDDEGRVRAIDSGQINQYLHQHLGSDYSAKDFRTWHATLRACELMRKVPLPEPCTDAACRRAVLGVVKEVAAELRNTPAVCRKSYINPVVFDAWRRGAEPFATKGRSRHSGGTAPLLDLLRKHRAAATHASRKNAHVKTQ